MVYITGEKAGIVYWEEVDYSPIDLDQEVIKWKILCYKCVHLWAVKPSYDNEHFLVYYSETDHMREKIADEKN